MKRKIVAFCVIIAMYITSSVAYANTQIKNISARDLKDYGLDLLTIALSVDNLPSDATVYVAAYNQSGRLTALKSVDSSLKTNISNKDVHYVKAFIWDGMSSVCPSFTQNNIR